MRIFTITARNYLAQALTLGDSVEVHHPEAEFTVFVADGLEGLDEGRIRHRLADARAVFEKELIEDLAFKYDVTEFCTALKPGIFRHILESGVEVGLVFYLDPDTFLYGRLDGLVDAEPDKTLFLTPHLVDCRLADDNPYPEYRHLWEGIFNLGFCGMRRTPRAFEILDWWHARLRDYAYADLADGLHTDQKWMDYAPAYWGGDLHVIRHYGVNVAHWNLIERALDTGDEGPTCRGEPLLLFHFSGLDFDSGRIAERHVPRRRQVYWTAALNVLVDAYRARVEANGREKYSRFSWPYASFDDGVRLGKIHRRLYRVYSRLGRPTAPFDAGGPFRRALAGARLIDCRDKITAAPARAGGAPARAGGGGMDQGRLTSLAQRLLSCVLRIGGARKYDYLLRFCAHYSRHENHAFLLKKASVKAKD